MALDAPMKAFETLSRLSLNSKPIQMETTLPSNTLT